MEKGQTSMRSTFRAIFLALLLVAAFAVPTVRAQPRAGSPGPLDAYPCQRTEWATIQSNSVQFNHPYPQPFESLQAKLNVLVDPDRDGLYCGWVASKAVDTLYAGCLTFEGDVFVHSGGYIYEGSTYNVYHCSALTYDFAGPAWQIACQTGGGYIQAVAYVAEYDDNVITGRWNC